MGPRVAVEQASAYAGVKPQQLQFNRGEDSSLPRATYDIIYIYIKVRSNRATGSGQAPTTLVSFPEKLLSTNREEHASKAREIREGEEENAWRTLQARA